MERLGIRGDFILSLHGVSTRASKEAKHEHAGPDLHGGDQYDVGGDAVRLVAAGNGGIVELLVDRDGLA